MTMLLRSWLFGAILTWAACIADAAVEPGRLVGLAEFQELCVPTHVGVFGDLTTVTMKQKGIVYRRGSGPWAKIPVDLKGAHSIARLPNGRWLINDTDNNRMVQLDDLSGKGKVVIRTKLAGFALSRPHDQIVDPSTGDIYVIDGNRRLFRFKDIEGRIEVWEFTEQQMGYVRSLSWFDGRLHVIDSSRGEVLRIDDYKKHRYTAFRSPRPKDGDFPAGAWATTGLVLNDVERAGDWYYGTNFFTSSFASGADTDPARLIRWRSWADFERGSWEELSRYLPEAPVPLVPYFLTIHDNTLYTGVFDHDEPAFGPVDWKAPCKNDRIVALDLTLLGSPHQYRHPPIEGAPNFRDLGGYRTTDGNTVKWGVLYRSDALNDITERDRQYLGHLNIGRVVDFRSKEEVSSSPDRLPPAIAAKRVSLPVVHDARAPLSEETQKKLATFDALDDKTQLEVLDQILLTQMYPGFVQTGTPAYRMWIHGLVDTPESAEIFHCNGGADRTGFAAAVLLLALGVPRSTVMDDYLMTNRFLFTPQGRVFLDRRLDVKLPASMRLHPRYLEAAFAEMEEEFGSIDAYLREGLGVDEDFRQKLRDRYLDAPTNAAHADAEGASIP